LDPDVLARFGQTLVSLQLRYMEAFVDLTVHVAEYGEAVPGREEADWQSLLSTLRSTERASNDVSVVLSRERRRMAGLLSLRTEEDAR
jgi:hypothetical protein